MTKRETKKAIYTAIVKEQKTHQETFDTLRGFSDLDTETLADEVAKVPSAAKQQKQRTLIYIYVVLLGLVIILRLLGVYAMTTMTAINPGMLLILIALGVVVPAVGIYGALTTRIEVYRTVGILLILSVVRSFTKEQFPTEIIGFLVLIPFVAAAFFSFYIPTRCKTAYSKKIRKEEVDGKERTSVEYVFDDFEKWENKELLDVEVKH